MHQLLLQKQLQELDPLGVKTQLLARSNVNRVNPGDLVKVQSAAITPATSSAEPVSGVFTSFTGTCIAIRRKGIDSTLLLRNMVNKLGVEMWVKVYSPRVKEINIIKRGEGVRRAKLYYLRNSLKE